MRLLPADAAADFGETWERVMRLLRDVNRHWAG